MLLFYHFAFLLYNLHNFTGFLWEIMARRQSLGQIHEVNSTGEHCIEVNRKTFEHGTRALIFKLLRSPRIDSKELILPGCVA
jgi:hypothetical protein